MPVNAFLRLAPLFLLDYFDDLSYNKTIRKKSLRRKVMAYTALYRRFRPQRFEELVGQDHIVRTLLNQLETGRIAHAYLFSGPRGTGKTSTAKLFARAINCANPKNGDPCGECDSCRAFVSDGNMDIIEIDAASNNGVDNIRDIRDKVVFAPAYGKYKVYIIDEVHMLSGGAFNALLKTLEEPPKHVVFILATTEIHKIPATILSRCQRFDFKLIPVSTISSRLEYALKESGVNIEKEAVGLIARCADGGMRDALSLADVCISYCGNNITFDDVRSVLGVSDRSFVFDFADRLIASDSAGVLDACRKLEADGRDTAVFALELMEHLRDIMLAYYSPECDNIASLSGDIRDRLIEQARRADIARILRGLEILAAFEKDVKLHDRPDILLECAAVRICLPENEDDYIALRDRVSVLEQKVAGGVPVVQAVPVSEKPDLPPWTDEKPAAKPQTEVKKAAEPVQPSAQPAQKVAPVQGNIWRLLMDRLKQVNIPLYMILRSFDGDISGEVFHVYVPESAKGKIPLITKNADVLASLLEEIKGQKYKVEATVGARPEGEENAMMRAALDLFS